MFLRRFSRPSALSFVAVTAVAPVATVGVAWTGAACSSDFSTSDAPDASSDAQGVPADDGNSLVVAPPPPPGCNPAAKPSDSPACVDDAYGAFVNSNGDDNADGSKLTPFKTIQHAFTTNRARIYICAGTYDENVSLTKTVQKDLFGGFTCDTWTSSASAVVSVAPASGYALQIVSTASPLRIEGITFQAPPGTSTAPSSIAAFASQATGVAFANDTFLGADGFDNGSAVAGTTRNYDQDAGNVALGGNNGTTPLGGKPVTCTCADQTVTTGGHGGEGASTNPTGGPGVPGPSNAQASCSATTNIGGGGGSGQPGEPAASGAGAATYGDLSATTWSGAAGTSGGTGTIGQGGGGGAGQNGSQYVNGGGGGGCGGCGGGGGDGGAAGGSSFAFLSFDSSVSFSACLLKTGTPGNGGNGGSGQTGQFGGAPGAPGSGEGCAGGPGGRGGNGGGGGGGAGGLSVDVGYVGMPPSLTTSSTFFASVPAKGGQPGDSAATKGVDGANAATLDLESP